MADLMRWAILGLMTYVTVSTDGRPLVALDDPRPAREAGKKADHAESFALPGEDPPQPFVPLIPRTVEDRKRIEAITAYTVARALEDRRSWSEAVALLESALKLDPDSVTVLRRLSRLCFVLGRTESGVKYCKRVLELDPGDTDAISRLVLYYNRRNEPAGAEGVLKDVLANPRLDKTAPGRLVAEFELGKLYAGKLRQSGKAADSFARVVDALDDKAANRLSQADQRRILGGDESAAYQEFGAIFLQAQRYDLAIKAFERGLGYEPDDPQLPLLLAETLLKVNRADEALAQAERFIKRQPQGVEGYELLGKALTVLKRGDEITPRLEAAAKADSKNVALQYALADRYRETGQADRAERMYADLLKSQPTTQGFGALASSLFKRKRAKELLKILDQALTRPGGFDAVQDVLKGITDDPAFAEQLLDAGLKLLSSEPPALDRPGLLVLNQIAIGTGKTAKLLPVQRLLLKRNPSAQGYKEFIGVLANAKRFDEGIAAFDELFQRYPAERNARNLTDLAKFYRLADKPTDAEKVAREAFKLDPNDLDAQIQVVAVLGQTGKTDEALGLLREALKKDPANPAVSSLLGDLLTKAGRNDEAIEIFKGLIGKYPNNDEVIRIARSQMSIIYVNMGDYAKAEFELESLLERNPDETGVNNDLGYLYAEQGKNLEKAEVMIRKAVQAEPERAAYLDSLGWVLFKRGKVLEAVEPLEKAVRLSESEAGTDSTIYEHLGDVYFQLEDTTRAKASWTLAEKAAAKSTPPDKRLPEIRKKLSSLEKLGNVPKSSSGNTP